MKRFYKDKYLISTLIVSIVVALLIHFPEILSLSDRFDQHVLFPEMNAAGVMNEIIFTFVSLLILFFVNAKLFHYNNPVSRLTAWKIVCSFLLTWVLSNLLGQLFVQLHRHFDLPAIDAMLHHYLHPLRDFIMSSIVTGFSCIIHLVFKQQQIIYENQQLRTENVVNQYEALKNQLNPHMLFNSLNTLQSLIREAPRKALNYTQELSRVLRYTLQSNESQQVTLAEELDFADAYIFLMKMRYEENLNFMISVDEHLSKCLLPPMSLQVLIENAIKHNEISNRNPLTITIRSEADGSLSVSNPIQPKRTESAGTGIGLDNLSKRYRLLMHREIQISTADNRFTVHLPLDQPAEV